MTEDKYIQFVANYDDWVSVKKLKVESGTDPKSVMEFLASLGTGIDYKIEENLRKIVDLNKLDIVLKEIIVEARNADAVAKNISAINSLKVNQVIKEITSLQKLQKNELKELQEFCKAYAVRKTLKANKLMVDYSEVSVPGMKRLKKLKT
ncbi:MAG: DUF2666 family protein [archaeon]